jgi:hypothetical protein
MVNVGSKQMGSATSANIHAPRNSFTKRSFGRDLSNLQNGVLLDGQKQQSFQNLQGKVRNFTGLNLLPAAPEPQD